METMKLIYEEPVRKILDDIENTPFNRIVLLGGVGSGKTTILNAYQVSKNETDMLVVNCQLEEGIYSRIRNIDLKHLYHTIIVIQKILEHIKAGLKVYPMELLFLDNKLSSLLITILNMTMMGYETAKNLEDVRKNPSMLFEELIGILKANKINLQSITILVDDFDLFANSGCTYQRYVYYELVKYFRVILAVSSVSDFNNFFAKENLNSNCLVLNVDYSNDLSEVRKVLEVSIGAIIVGEDKNQRIYGINEVLSDSTIKELILRTNGNLTEILTIINLLKNISVLLKIEDCEDFVLKILSERTSGDPAITGIVHQRRVLNI